MNRINNIIFTLTILLSFSLISCDRDSLNHCDEHEVATCDGAEGLVNLRVRNSSEYDFCNVVLRSSKSGTLEAGQASCYRAYETVYRYDYIEFFIGETEFILQPFDFVGETPLPPGNYTYEIDLNDPKSGIAYLGFVED